MNELFFSFLGPLLAMAVWFFLKPSEEQKKSITSSLTSLISCLPYKKAYNVSIIIVFILTNLLGFIAGVTKVIEINNIYIGLATYSLFLTCSIGYYYYNSKFSSIVFAEFNP